MLLTLMVMSTLLMVHIAQPLGLIFRVRWAEIGEVGWLARGHPPSGEQTQAKEHYFLIRQFQIAHKLLYSPLVQQEESKTVASFGTLC